MQQKYFLPLGGQEKEILVYDSNNASFTYVAAGKDLTCVRDGVVIGRIIYR